MKEKYSRNIVFKDDDPKLIGTVYNIKFGGYEWNDASITIYKPLQKFLGVEFFQYGTLNSSCKKRYEEDETGSRTAGERRDPHRGICRGRGGAEGGGSRGEAEESEE